MPETIRESYLHFAKVTRVILTALVAVQLITGALSIYLVGRAAEAHDAVCTLRSDLEVRVKNSKAYLAEHPNGLPGIPAAAIRQSVEGQERTIHALSGLNCQH